MSLDLILDEARRRNVRLWVEGERLRYEAPKGALTDDILGRLRLHKAELLRRLRDPDAAEIHPVSFGQRALWFEYQLNPASSAYNYAFSATIRSPVHVESLRRAFQAIVDRHAILRTTYGLLDGEPVQRVFAYQPLAFECIDASGWSQSELSERVRASAHRPFDLQRGPVFRVELYRRRVDKYLLLLNAPHIAMDFRSLGVIVEELGHLYAAESGASLPPLPAVKTQYADYARWQIDMVAGEVGEAHWAFWRERLDREPAVLNLPTDRPRPAVRTYNGAAFSFALGPELSRDLKAFARGERVTLYTLLLAAFETLLHRYSSQDEFLIGSPMLGRTRPEFQRLAGYCISPVVLRADFTDDVSFRELLGRAHREVLAVLEHQDYPFALLVQRLQPARDASRSAFFDVMFNLNAADLEEGAGPPAGVVENRQLLDIQAEPQAQGEGQFDLILQIFDSGRTLTGTLEYNTDLFDATTIERMAGHLRELLAGIIQDADRRVSELQLLTDSERNELLALGAGEPRAFPVPGLLHALFEKQVERSPGAPALTFNAQSLTYQALNERANQLAWRLRAMGVGPEVLVGICVERSIEMVVGLLGILKAGGAYVPLDPAYPAERLAHMLADSGTPVVLTQESLLGQLPVAAAQVLCLDRDWPQIAGESGANPPALAEPGHPAYVIYTSGSTGRPKGVVVCHEQVVRLFTATDHWFGFNDRDVWTLFHSYAFDFSVWELWGALLYGGRLVVVPYLVSRSPDAFCRLLADEGVTVLNQTPSAFRQLIQAEAASCPTDDSRVVIDSRATGGLPASAETGGQAARGTKPLTSHLKSEISELKSQISNVDFQISDPGSQRSDLGPFSLRYVIFGGEALDLPSLRPWYERHGDTQPLLVNMYGITETTVHVTYRPLRWADVRAGRGSMIGQPIPDLELYVLDARAQPVPVGVPGELYVGGAGLARGYLNQPALTSERFIAHPFARDPGARLYRTGDLARRRPDGDVEYLGRVDQQVKIRGFRIEMGEIETTLKQCPLLADALVMAVGGVTEEKRLVAYVWPAAGARPTVEEVRHHARTRLPEYMVPALFVFLDAFPLTPNGKIDRKALPVVGTSRPELESQFEAPATPAERALAELWAEVLGVERIGIDDNFFSLGGDSILSIRVVAGAKKHGLSITLADVFQSQTIRELAASAASSAPPTGEPAKSVAPLALLTPADRANLPAHIQDAYPLTRLQAGMLFHAQLNPELAVYCNLSSLHLRIPFDPPRMQDAIDAVVARHPALRTSFDLTGFSEPLQLVHQQVSVPLTVEDIRYLAPDEQERHLREWIERERIRPFDPASPPLLRFHIHRRADDRIQLTWCEHHAILDGWSVASMLAEIVTRYLALCATGSCCATGDSRAAGDSCATGGLPASADTGGQAARGTREPSLRFADFVALERSVIDWPAERDFWTRRLDGVSATRLPRWERREKIDPRRRFGLHAVRLPDRLSGDLHEIARQLKVPIKSVLLAAHLKVLSTWSGRRDVLTGLIANGRPETAGSECVLGLFLNTVPLGVSLAPARWADLVRQVHENELEVLPHRRYPLADIQRGLGTQDLIETSFNFIHFHVYQGLADVGPIEVLDAIAYERTNFTLMATFSIDPVSERSDVGLMLHYDARELNEDQVQALADSYVNALTAMTGDPGGRHESASILPEANRYRVVGQFNDTCIARPAPRCLHEFFAAQASRAPDAIAVVCGNENLTYENLRARSDRLARHLQSLGVGPETLVGICMERSADLVVALLGVLQAGGAYVPLDPAYPAERLQFILEDAKAPIVIASEGSAGHLKGYNGRVVSPDGIACPSPQPPAPNPFSFSPSPSPHNLAYIIYTSGSTGRPKGVAIEHRSACELMHWARDTYSDAELAGVLASTSICFDLSVFEIFVPLSWGGRIIVVPNVLALPDLPADANVTLVNTVPSAMAELVRLDGLPATVQTVNLAGEPLSPQLVDQIHAGGAVERVYDLYGPSEDTTYSTFARRVAGGRATIGRPISNSRVYILDEDLQPVPPGATGELYIAGAGLARGYLGRGDLTAERFIPDPFASEPSGRMYRTGDLGRWLPDGNIEFLGRADYQVKIRGFRIELGEIEAAMKAMVGVRDAAVSVVGEDGEKRLVAYYVTQAGGGSTESDIRGHLSARLPSHMVPAGLVELAAMPMTPNGKIDRKALPAWRPASTSPACLVAPRDEVEEKIAFCWRDLLKLDRIGIDDNFFELGGHSLLATQVVSRLREIYAIPLALRSIFDAPTVAGLAEVVRQARSGRQPAAGQSGEQGEREEIEL